MNIKKRLLRTFALALIGLAIGGAIAYIQVSSESAHVIKQNVTQNSGPSRMAGVNLGGSFDLMDHNGKAVTAETYDGKYKLIYFGFTYCPAICPTELQKITQVMNKLDEEFSKQIQPLFITVDPERDTAEVMAEYVSLFHPELIGLTGTTDQIGKVMKDYKIFATKVEDDSMSEYTMDHSSFIYFMSMDNKPLGIYRMQDDADYIVGDILKILASS